MKVFPAILLTIISLRAELLYETDFDDFPTGENQWAGFDSWITNDSTSGAQSIDETVLPALLKTASLGFARPNSGFTFVALDLGYDHVTIGEAIVEIDTLIGIEDSTNNRRDDFYLSIYNSAGDRLSSIRLDNEDPGSPGSKFGIWQEDGTNQFDTYYDFIPGELFNLVTTLDLEKEIWSADVGGLPLFTDQQITNTGNPVNLGFVAFEWQVSSPIHAQHGDNFLLVADIIIQTITEDPQLAVTHSIGPDGSVTLNWQTFVGWNDQVQFSTDLMTWFDTLPNSSFDNIATSAPVNFTVANNGPKRFYRVRRTKAP